MVFDNLRQTLEDLMNRHTAPEDRREIASRMRDTLVQAKVGLADLRDALTKAKARLAAEEREVETMKRRRELAERIGDAETGTLASKHEQLHAERVAVLQRKIAAQEDELAIAEREVAEMAADLRTALAGGAPPPSAGAAVGTGEDLGEDGAPLASEIDALGRARARAEREEDASRRLDELKRRMGK